ncbi:MAG: hypothetical protein J3R72DRAFT_494613 [Linnemannia gamsii]|nr:MAG: hypothetical protein J3R72DRAFT_494613 [Linnemannia gamsii]
MDNKGSSGSDSDSTYQYSSSPSSASSSFSFSFSFGVVFFLIRIVFRNIIRTKKENLSAASRGGDEGGRRLTRRRVKYGDIAHRWAGPLFWVWEDHSQLPTSNFQQQQQLQKW